MGDLLPPKGNRITPLLQEGYQNDIFAPRDPFALEWDTVSKSLFRSMRVIKVTILPREDYRSKPSSPTRASK